MKRTFIVGAIAVAASVFACGSDSSSSSSGSSGTTEVNGPGAIAAATVAKGEEAVGKRRCATCHDSPAGTMAGATTPLKAQLDGTPITNAQLYPPNLTPDIETGLGDPNDPVKGYTDTRLADAIRVGKDRDGLKLCPQMQHNPDMSDFEVYSIIKYLRSLPPKKNKVPRSICPPLKTGE